MFYLLSLINSTTISYGNVLTLYRDDKCQKCKEFADILIAREIEFNIVECDNRNDCPEVPTLIYTKNRLKKAQSTDLSILDQIVEELQILKLEGPWMIIFYENQEPIMEKYLMKAALKFPELNVGKIHKSLVPDSYTIHKYPSLIAFYNSLIKVYEYSYSDISLASFISTLLEPFRELTYSEFQNINTHIFFIVFYQSEQLANYHFKPFAHKYKFISRFYKSSDPDLLKAADIDFLKLRSPQSASSDVLVLSVYKHKRFHKLIITQFNETVIDEWIFLSHYSHLTRVTTNNFYTVFHALKPVILLLTRNEQFFEEMEKVSEEMHESKSFVSYIFAMVDVDLMTGFVETLLPGLDVPKILVYDPSRYLYFVDDSKVIDVSQYIKTIVKKYEKGLLMHWPRNKKRIPKFFILSVFFVVVLCFYAVKCIMKRKIKIH